MKYAVIAILLCSTALTGCATNGAMLPVGTKAEARQNPAGSPIILKANYLKLARYWDENSAKPYTGLIDPKSRARMEIFAEDKTAHLICGDAFIHGLIELKGRADGSTVMTTYAWGNDYKTVTKWRDMIAAAPFVEQ